MRVREALAALVALAVLATPATAQARLLGVDGDGNECVLRSGRDDYRRVDRHRAWEVRAKRPNLDVAGRADAIVASEEIWTTYSGELGQPRRDVGRDGGRLPFQIFVSGEVPDDADGLTAEYCERPVADAVVIRPIERRSHLKSVLAHELFHAFSAGVGDGLVLGWWDEATASWGEMQFTRDEATRDQYDRHFLQRPELPLDTSGAVDDGHQYGAWRFIQWLEGRTDVWSLMVATFQRMGRGEDGIHAVLHALGGRGRELGPDLGEFWGDHLRPLSPVNGPATRGETVRFPRDEPTGDDESVEMGNLRANRLAAAVVRLRLFRDSNVQSITIEAEPVPPGTFLWVQNGNDLDNWSDGGSADFCVGGFSRTTGAKAWPGEFPVAFTNGHHRPPAVRQQLRIRFSAEECNGYVRDPSAAVDESPSLELPDSCPDAPVYFPPPDPHTDYYVLRERIDRVYLSQVDWQHAALMRVNDRDLGRRSAGRLFARWLYCSARRARDLDHLPETDEGPDELIRRWLRRFVSATREAARKYEHGRFFDAIDPLQRAGLKYGQITTRATVQDIETGPGAG